MAEVDGAARLPAAVSDLVVAFGDRGGDAPGAQPCSVRLRRIALVREDTLRPGSRPALAGARDADVLEHGGHHRGVVDVPSRDHHPQRPAAPIGDEMQLGGQPATRAPNSVVRRLIDGSL